MKRAFLYRSLEQTLAEGIRLGRWQPGDRLPSIRALVDQSGYSKTTVMRALNRLEEEGLVEARAKAGFFVCTTACTTAAAVSEASSLPAPVPVSVKSVTQELMCRSAAFDIFPDAGIREPLTSGLQVLNRTVSRELRQQRGLHQYYDEPAGSSELREVLARRYLRGGCQVQADDFTITAGCQQALSLALSCLCQPGDLVAVESPGFYGVLQLLEQLGVKVLEIPSDPQTGMRIEVLEQVLQQWPVRACVVTPCFATPTGASMSPEHQQRLLALADQHDFYVVEDDIYRELAFGQPASPLLAHDRNGRVLLCGSVSKTLSRDLRLGWVISARWQEEIRRMKLVTSLATSRYVQQGLAAFINTGEYDRHLRRYIPVLRQQRDQLIRFIQERWPVACGCTVPQGGLAAWLTLPESVSAMALYANARERGVLITPGPLFSASERFRNGVRISYAHPWNQQRLQALQTLGEVLGAMAEADRER